ncbi:MAG: (Fe-S)-binding protein [FCB group bacterium]|nr:(Fe-S)-binding protein [FCB group bacterium]
MADIRVPDTLLQECIHCGLCLTACPTYLTTGLEAESPRGRLMLFENVFRGEVSVPVDHLETCLDCRACETACPSGVDYHNYLERYQEIKYSQQSLSLMRKIGLKIVTRRPLLNTVFRLVSLVQKVRLLKLMAFFSDTFRGIPQISKKSFLKESQNHSPAIGKSRGKVAFFSGCIMDGLYADVHHATLRVLRWNGFTVDVPPDQTCCGALHQHTGGYTYIERLHQINLEAFRESDIVINNSAGCGAWLKTFGDVRFTAKIRDITEFLLEANLVSPVNLRHGWRILYDAPCHLEHVQGIADAPAELLKKFGYEIAEFPESQICCGAAGAYVLTHPHSSAAILKMKMADIKRAGEVNAVVTANPGCHLQLQKGCDLYAPAMNVWHICQALDNVYRLDEQYRNTFKLSN